MRLDLSFFDISADESIIITEEEGIKADGPCIVTQSRKPLACNTTKAKQRLEALTSTKEHPCVWPPSIAPPRHRSRVASVVDEPFGLPKDSKLPKDKHFL